MKKRTLKSAPLKLPQGKVDIVLYPDDSGEFGIHVFGDMVLTGNLIIKDGFEIISESEYEKRKKQSKVAVTRKKNSSRSVSSKV